LFSKEQRQRPFVGTFKMRSFAFVTGTRMSGFSSSNLGMSGPKEIT
jgi:hypothetical protein